MFKRKKINAKTIFETLPSCIKDLIIQYSTESIASPNSVSFLVQNTADVERCAFEICNKTIEYLRKNFYPTDILVDLCDDGKGLVYIVVRYCRDGADKKYLQGVSSINRFDNINRR
ncbi:hypothetical protein [Butyrivibrio sp. WCD2001]|uniref:hypothetical protein n=1 Tax=Butyrivibrio sp. WCD2001 TaxID=1280681 RepID=UPI00047A72EB|nr:hypothetical protein [Butyrivibrio sp. WCD2001]